MKRSLAIPAAIALAAHTWLLFGFSPPHIKTPDRPRTSKTDPIELVLLPKPLEEGPPIECGAAREAKGEIPPPVGLERSSSEVDPRAIVMEVPVFRNVGVVTTLTSIPHGPFGEGPGEREGMLNGIFGAGALDDTPRAKVQLPPVYPPAMRAAGIEGEVVVDFIVDENGRVLEPHVTRSTHREFEEAALRATARWRFHPGLRKNLPVRFRMSVPIRFSLDNESI